MTLVLDATAAIAIVARTTGVDSHLADATRVIAPDLIVAETLNVRWKYRRAGLVPPDLGALFALYERITLVAGVAYAADADALAAALDHPVYDCLYAAVARRERGRVLTADRRFAEKMGAADVDVVVFA